MATNTVIKLKRGEKANLPTSGMSAGEPYVTTDRGTLHIATSDTDKLPVVPAIEDLMVMDTIVGSEDLLIIHDASELVGQKEKKITVDDFRASLKIPPVITDEKFALGAGLPAGYVWNTDGNDGVIRMGTSMQWVKDVSDTFVTMDVKEIDGGTF